MENLGDKVIKQTKKETTEKINKSRFQRFCHKYLYLILCFFGYFILDVAFRYGYRTYGSLSVGHPMPMLFTLCWCVILTSIVWLLPRIGKRIFMLVTIAFYSALVLAHCCLSRFFNRFFSFSMMGFADDGAEAFDTSYLSVRKLVICAIIFCIALMIAACIFAPKEKYKCSRTIPAAALIVLSIAGIFGVKAGFMPKKQVTWDQYMSNNSVYSNFTDTFSCMYIAGLYQYTFRDSCLAYGVYDVFEKLSSADTVQELDAYYDAKETDPDNDMTGIFKGKNLILVQLESVDTWMLNETAMPNLYRLQQEGINFENFYAPIYLAGPTFSTESIVNSGLVSPFVGISNTIYTKNYYPYSMAHLFSDLDYSVNSYHTASYMYDRKTVHPNWGYESFNCYEDMGMSEPKYDSDLLNGYDKMVKYDENFFSFIITYSAHGTYADGDGYDDNFAEFEKILPAGTDKVFIQSYAHTSETDKFIGELYDRLKADGLLENTVLMFYTDHYNKYVKDNALVMKYKGVDDYRLLQSVPCFLYYEGMEPQTISKYTSTIDILPTVANLFGLETDGRYYIGNDMFSDNGGYVFFADGSWIDEEDYHVSGQIDVDSEKIAERHEEIDTRLNASWETMKTDYFAQKVKR